MQRPKITLKKKENVWQNVYFKLYKENLFVKYEQKWSYLIQVNVASLQNISTTPNLTKEFLSLLEKKY